MSNLQELKFKILIIGDSGVGKTSMLLKYVDNYFPDTHIATIGVEYKTKTIFKGKYKITLNIWDTAGQERFKSITKSFFSNTT
jgi:small GTP-binding protein